MGVDERKGKLACALERNTKNRLIDGDSAIWFVRELIPGEHHSMTKSMDEIV